MREHVFKGAVCLQCGNQMSTVLSSICIDLRLSGDCSPLSIDFYCGMRRDRFEELRAEGKIPLGFTWDLIQAALRSPE